MDKGLRVLKLVLMGVISIVIPIILISLSEKNEEGEKRIDNLEDQLTSLKDSTDRAIQNILDSTKYANMELNYMVEQLNREIDHKNKIIESLNGGIPKTVVINSPEKEDLITTLFLSDILNRQRVHDSLIDSNVSIISELKGRLPEQHNFSLVDSLALKDLYERLNHSIDRLNNHLDTIEQPSELRQFNIFSLPRNNWEK